MNANSMSNDPTTPNKQADGIHTTPADKFPRNCPTQTKHCGCYVLSESIHYYHWTHLGGQQSHWNLYKGTS